ncbi:MAG: hypothetical protein Q9204_008198 [Flavoplaca sp. TL-2023a]
MHLSLFSSIALLILTTSLHASLLPHPPTAANINNIPIHKLASPPSLLHARADPPSPQPTYPANFPGTGPNFTPSPSSFSEENQPSTSGPFTPITLPPHWTLYPPSSTTAILPLQLSAPPLIQFYTSLLSHCFTEFWSPTPATPLLNTGLRFGPFLVTVIGGVDGSGDAVGGVPWGILGLMAMGMLERAKRGWVSTWDGVLVGPGDGVGWRVVMSVDGQDLGGGHIQGEGLECEEGEVGSMDGNAGSGSEGEMDEEEEERRRKGKRVCRD